MSNVQYPWIRKWGKFVGIRPFDVLALIWRAHDEAAPPGAIYRDEKGHWYTIADIHDLETLTAFDLIISQDDHSTPGHSCAT